jgi:hypothetical protein
MDRLYLNGTTNENIPSTVEYLTTNDWENDAIIGPDTVIQLLPNDCYDFRYRATDTTLASYEDGFCTPSRPIAPAFTIDYAAETTVEKVPPAQEYADNDTMENAITGADLKAALEPDMDMYFRLKSTSTEFSGEIFQLIVPERPPAVSYAIDYVNEATYQVIAATDEYAYDSAMTSPVTGSGAILSLSPGVNVYIRTKQTGSFFAGETFMLEVPVRPEAPIVSLSDQNSSSAIFKKSQDGTGANVTEADGYEYTTDNGNNWYPIFNGTTVDASGDKNIFVRIKATPIALASKLSVNVDFEHPWITLKTDSACNSETNFALVTTNVDNGSMYIILRGVPQTSESDMINAVVQNNGAVVEITDNYIDHQISTSDLNPGYYFAYAVNITSEVKATSLDSMKVNQNPDIDLGADLVVCPEKVTVLDPGAGYSLYDWSLVDSTGQTLSISSEGTYYVKVTDNHGCFDSDTMVISHIIPYENENICVVTVELENGNNLVVWEKSPDAGIASYNVYREENFLGNILYGDLSTFEDSLADPEKRTYQYYLAAVDSCGNESDWSPYHQPIFLQFKGTVDKVDLSWSKYVVQDDSTTFINEAFSSYTIFRGSDSTRLDTLEEGIPLGIETYTDTDPLATQWKYYYRVAGAMINPCEPDADNKAGAGPYHHALSNLDNNRQSATGMRNQLTSGKLNIYPNPVSDWALIAFSNPYQEEYQLVVTDLAGKVVRIRDNISTNRIEFNREGLSPGIYLIELRGSKIFRGKIVVN